LLMDAMERSERFSGKEHPDTVLWAQYLTDIRGMCLFFWCYDMIEWEAYGFSRSTKNAPDMVPSIPAQVAETQDIASNPSRGIDTQTVVTDKPAPTTGSTSPNKGSETQSTATVSRLSFLRRLLQRKGS